MREEETIRFREVSLALRALMASMIKSLKDEAFDDLSHAETCLAIEMGTKAMQTYRELLQNDLAPAETDDDIMPFEE